MRRLVWALLPSLTFLLAAGEAGARTFRVFAPAAPGTGFEESFRRVFAEGYAPARAAIEAAAISAAEEVSAPAAAPRPKEFWIAAVSVGVLGGSAWNSFGDGPSQGFHFTDEGWFGRTSFLGGVDKASHFVSYYVTARLLDAIYQELDAPASRARLLGAGVSALAGLVTEIGDAHTAFGFSYEDLIADCFGAAAALGVAHFGLDDLIGFRAGLVPAPEPACCPDEGYSRDYSPEIYTGDLKIAGLARRLRFRPGPARYFLFSISYGSKGYPYSDPAVRERQIGLELGVNFGEVLAQLGVPRQRWWGKLLYFVFDVVRFPYTSVGFQYDLNSGRWRGPGIGDSFPGGEGRRPEDRIRP